MARAKRQHDDRAAESPPAPVQVQCSPSVASPASWQQRAEALRAALPDASRALQEARTRVAPRLRSVFASADEASAALLETDAERDAFMCMAEASACPGTGVALTAEQLAERLASSADVRESLTGLCGTLASRHSCLFTADDSGCISLAVDIPAVAYMPGHTGRRRQGPLALAVQLPSHSDCRRSLQYVPAKAASLRKRVPALKELSDDAIWVMVAGLQAISPVRRLSMPPEGAAMRSGAALEFAVSEHAAGRSPISAASTPIPDNAAATVGDCTKSEAAALPGAPPAAQPEATAAASSALDSPAAVVTSAPPCAQHAVGHTKAQSTARQARASNVTAVAAEEVDPAVTAVAPIMAKRGRLSPGPDDGHQAAAPRVESAAGEAAAGEGAAARAPGTRGRRQRIEGASPYSCCALAVSSEIG